MTKFSEFGIQIKTFTALGDPKVQTFNDLLDARINPAVVDDSTAVVYAEKIDVCVRNLIGLTLRTYDDSIVIGKVSLAEIQE